MIWGANLRGFGESEADSIGCGNERLLEEAELGVMDGEWEWEELSCDALSLLALRECLILVSTGWGKARRCFVALTGRSAEEGVDVDLLLSSIGWDKGKGFGGEGAEWGGMIVVWVHSSRTLYVDDVDKDGDDGW